MTSANYGPHLRYKQNVNISLKVIQCINNFVNTRRQTLILYNFPGNSCCVSFKIILIPQHRIVNLCNSTAEENTVNFVGHA